MQWTVRNIRVQNQESVASFYSLWLVVLRCFEIPLTEAEPRKGRELLAKRGEQKIRKNQVQAICHFLVATLWIEGHQLPRHQSLRTLSYKFSWSVVQGACGRKCFSESFFLGLNGQIWWFGSTLFCSVQSSKAWMKGLMWEASEGMFACWHVVPGWNDEGKEEAYGREEDIWRIEGPKMCPIINRHKCCWGIDTVHHSATCSTNCYD